MVQKLLSHPEFEAAHSFLANIIYDEISEEDANKIKALYNRGCDAGIFDCSGDTDDACRAINKLNNFDNTECEGDCLSTPSQNKFTISYSAIKNGQIKTGICYSNAPTIQAAKKEALSKLAEAGYSSIRILTVEYEYCDSDSAFCMSTGICEDEKESDSEAADPESEASDENKDTSDNDGDMVLPNDKESSEAPSKSNSSAQPADNDAETFTQDTSDDDSPVSNDDKSSEGSDNDTAPEQTSDDDGDFAWSPSDEESTDSPADDGSLTADDDSSDDETAELPADNEDDEAQPDKTQKSDKPKKLTKEEKTTFRDEFKRIFKSLLTDWGVIQSFEFFTLRDKAKFLTQLADKWEEFNSETEPFEFLSNKDREQIITYVPEKIKKDDDSDK